MLASIYQKRFHTLTVSALAVLLFPLLLACTNGDKPSARTTAVAPASSANGTMREAPMSIQEFDYKDKHIVIRADTIPPQVTINGEAIAVARNNADSFTATQHLPFASFSSLEELARQVIDLQEKETQQ